MSTHLDLSSQPQKLHKIPSLPHHTHLISLNLANNMLTTITGISSLIQLRHLNLDFNQIGVLEGLEELTQLEDLSIGYNCV